MDNAWLSWILDAVKGTVVWAFDFAGSIVFGNTWDDVKWYARAVLALSICALVGVGLPSQGVGAAYVLASAVFRHRQVLVAGVGHTVTQAVARCRQTWFAPSLCVCVGRFL